MKYLLDTNTCIQFLNGRVPKVRERMLSVSGEYIAISTVTQAEMAYGAAKSLYPEKSLEKQQFFFSRYTLLTFDSDAALMYGRIRANLETMGKPIGPYDMQIAAIALVHQLILVTHNTREFSRIESLEIEDWEL